VTLLLLHRWFGNQDEGVLQASIGYINLPIAFLRILREPFKSALIRVPLLDLNRPLLILFPL